MQERMELELARELTTRGKALLVTAVGLMGLFALSLLLDAPLTDPLPRALLFGSVVAAAPLLVQILLAPRIEELELSVASRRTRAGAPFRETLHLQHGGRVLNDLLVMEPATRGYTGPAFVEVLLPDETQRISLLCRAKRRGHQRSRRFVLETSHPFGLVQTRARIEVPGELIVEPSRLRMPIALLEAALEGNSAQFSTDLLLGQEYHSLREYRLGEDARRVHALRSAALGTLVRRVERGHLPSVLALVVDLRRAPGRDTERGGVVLGKELLEWSLSAAATLVDALPRNGTRLHALLISRDQVRDLRIHDAQDARQFLLWLAESRAHPSEGLPQPWEGMLRERLSDCENGYWIAAGGHFDDSLLDRLGTEFLRVERRRWR
jgi:uncharacterized protein (DUF58 family)